MNFEQAPDELDRLAAQMRGVQPDSQAVMRSVHEVASLVRASAARAGDSVGVRVLSRQEGVRITVIGPRAARYKGMIQTEMSKRLPSIQTEIRTQIARKSR